MQQKGKGKQNKKKHQDEDIPGKKDLIRQCKETNDMDQLLQWTHHEDNDLCPCKVMDDIEELWDRVFEMVDDDDVRIRQRILHIICDGSPPRLESKVLDALDKFNRDSDSDIRRTAHKVLAKASRGGSWNIL